MCTALHGPCLKTLSQVEEKTEEEQVSPPHLQHWVEQSQVRALSAPARLVALRDHARNG